MTNAEKSRKAERATSNITLIDDIEINYNVDELEDFMRMVFHATDPEDETNQTLLWASGKPTPGYARSEDEVLGRLRRTKKPMSLYFCTATCKPHPLTGKLHNRKSLFKQFHVLVLDDIGTKVPIEKIPEELEPTYIIESSEGNFQYGYVLDEPIEVMEEAKALVQLAYEGGFSDAGGMMPTKLVRLPGGRNGKPGSKQNFMVKLRKKDGPYWTPQALLRAMDLNVMWKDVVKDVKGAIKRQARGAVGTTPWAKDDPAAPGEGGVVDPLLEWLYRENKVLGDSDHWVSVKCPWHDAHTTGDDDAGYSPLGRGDSPEMKRIRGFKCFHGHCSHRNIDDFMTYMMEEGAPEVSEEDGAAELVASWVYDSSTDFVWQINGIEQPRPITMKAFKNTFPKKVRVFTRDGKAKMVPETQIWLLSDRRVVVQGQTFDPTDTGKIVKHGNDLLVNMFHQPEWGDGDYDEKDVDMFKQFLEYLIPLETDREYFLNWLSAKCQNLGFRGAAILMIAKQQGTGRTTLSDMIETMIGSANVENVPFNRLTGDGVFNEWLEKPLVVTNETKDTSDTKGYYRVYEGLKEYIDPRPKRERINPKYGHHRFSTVHSSYLMFSNHENALAVAGNDRRFFVMRNAMIPAEPAYFTRLNAWLQEQDVDGKPKWAKSVWRWLRQRNIDLDELLAPAPSTDAKKDMLNAVKNPVQVAIETAVNAWEGDFVSAYKVKEIVISFATRLKLHDVPNFDAQLKAVVNGMTEPVNAASILKVEGKNVRPKIKTMALTRAGYPERFIHNPLGKADRAVVRECLNGLDEDYVKQQITAALDLLES
jgi:hypothetical protein